jgi:hypothetical protein
MLALGFASLPLQDDFKHLCRKMTHLLLDKEAKHQYNPRKFDAKKVRRFMDDYIQKKGGSYQRSSKQTAAAVPAGLPASDTTPVANPATS